MESRNKVAEITFLFWLMKIIATTLGETFGDHISVTLNLGYAISLGITALGFVALLSIHLSVQKYIPLTYWLVIIGTTTMGTEISDFIDRSLHLGYAGGSLLLVGGLVVTLVLWFRFFRDLSVYPIIDRKKEVFYWVAILFSNSLGTAFGDFLSDVIGLSYLQGAMVTAFVIILVMLLHYATRTNTILLFWLAFIFTRPFGATFGDFLTKPIAKGGMELETMAASTVSAALLLVLILVAHYQQFKRNLF